MTQLQQTALKAFKKNPDVVPDELSNLLVEDCLEELEKQLQEAREAGGRFRIYLNDSVSYGYEDFGGGYPYIYSGGSSYNRFSDFSEDEKIIFLLAVLSRPDDQAVMSFLDVENKEVKEFIKDSDQGLVDYERYNYQSAYEQYFVSRFLSQSCPQTLDHLLYREFTEALRTGKTFDQALAIINKIYLINRYV